MCLVDVISDPNSLSPFPFLSLSLFRNSLSLSLFRILSPRQRNITLLFNCKGVRRRKWKNKIGWIQSERGKENERERERMREERRNNDRVRFQENKDRLVGRSVESKRKPAPVSITHESTERVWNREREREREKRRKEKKERKKQRERKKERRNLFLSDPLCQFSQFINNQMNGLRLTSWN